ncbi:MAG: tRNA (guanosine(46)-N7)-methyltransferase TrmB [Gammaproteobacteria bacterium HGW-Gammaproteobacteria-8]|nr:MAG: tRNA (guanosine(46)-N7)-methyltransferase TrmB [Gammaproteobacteria bacterium HGW-Gammaproteobacteria-8]
MTDQAEPPDARRRRVRSFVRRPGRLTPAQARALEELLPRYALDPLLTDLRHAFDRPAPLIVEIGCGNGDALIEMVSAEAERNFIGIEVHEPGVGRLLRGLHEHRLDNVRVAMRDAVEVLREQAAVDSIDGLRIYFPDPWPKKRHHKRRLIQPEFVALAASRLAPGGLLHLATDWAPYAEWMVEVLAGESALQALGDPFVEAPVWRPQTHFERRGTRRGHAIFDLLYRKIAE